MKSPFKFLDSYTKEDKEIFFGREKETEELYRKVFNSKLLLLYGISGTGKTSLINCGLANKFEDSDWLPLSIRRGKNMNKSIRKAIDGTAITVTKHGPVVDKLQSLYLDHFKPVYLIFDQLEELYIFGSKNERKEFIDTIKSIIDSDLQCKIILSMREEYIAGLAEFEEIIPQVMDNRFRVEKITRVTALETINGPCTVNGIKTESGFAEALLNKLSPDENEIELTYMQILLDRIYKLSIKPGASEHKFSTKHLSGIGEVSDLLGEFLEEQINLCDNPDDGLVILKSFVSVKGTKKQQDTGEAIESVRSLGKNISESTIEKQIRSFVNLRILRDKDENGRYELRHDSLATKIYEYITAIEKDIIEVIGFLEQAYSDYLKRKRFLSSDDLAYIAPYSEKIYLKQDIRNFIDSSQKEAERINRRRRLIIIVFSAALFIVLTSLTIWAYKERGTAILMRSTALQKMAESDSLNKEAQDARQEAEIQKNLAFKNEELALNAKEIAEKELYESIINTWTVSAERMNVLYAGIDNPVSIVVSGIPSRDLLAVVTNGSIRLTENGFIIRPVSVGECIVSVLARAKNGELIDLGNRSFRIKEIPQPEVIFEGKDDLIFTKEELMKIDTVRCSTSTDFAVDYDDLYITYFEMWVTLNGYTLVRNSGSDLITPGMKDLISRCNHGDKIFISNIKATSSWSNKNIYTPPAILTIRDTEKLNIIDSLFVSLADIVDKKYSEESMSELKQMRTLFQQDNNSALIKNVIDTLQTKYYYSAFEWKIPILSEIDYYMKQVNDLTLEYKSSDFNKNASDNLKNRSVESIIKNNPNEGIKFALEAINISSQYYNNNEAFSVYTFASLAESMTEYQKDKLLAIYETDEYYLKYALSEVIDSLELTHPTFLARYKTGWDTLSPTTNEVILYGLLTESEIKERILKMSLAEKNQYSSHMSLVCYWSLTKRRFKQALRAGKIAVFADSTYLPAYTNLSLSYLFNDLNMEALEIYTYWKNKPYDKEYPTFREAFIADLDDMESQGITHPDFEKIRELLNK